MTDPHQLLFLFLFLSSWTPFLCDDIKTIPVMAGQNVTLECQVPKDDVIAVLEWKKLDLKSDKYVFYFRGDKVDDNFQDKRFLNRVQLRDPERKNGDVSVVLKNVTVNDSGKYECRVLVEPNGSRRRRREAHEHVSAVELSVTEPGHTDGQTGGGNQGGGNQGGGNQGGGNQGGGNLHVPFGLTAAAAAALFGVIVTVVIGVLIRRRKKSDQPAGDDDAEQQTLSS